MSRLRTTRAFLFFAVIAAALGLFANTARAAGAGNDHTVLILDTTVIGGASSVEATKAAAQGLTVEIATAAQWTAKSAADFTTYRALILGDPSCSTSAASMAAAEVSRTTWSPAVNGNIIIIGTDEVFHSGTGGADTLTNNGIAFAAAQVGKTGLFVSLSCYYTSSTPTPVTVIDQFGTFTAQAAPGCFDDAHIVASHPALVGLTDAGLSGWGCSVHEVFTTFPTASFSPLVIAKGVTGAGSLTFADGTSGIPYILASGAGLVPVGTTVTEIPTLSFWMLVLMALTLAAASVLVLKRR
jgi:hypothetical protein